MFEKRMEKFVDSGKKVSNYLIIFMDYNMPEYDGSEAVKRIREIERMKGLEE
jgi:CheY-like chemotaxis protein